jgi:hypothetical protein
MHNLHLRSSPEVFVFVRGLLGRRLCCGGGMTTASMPPVASLPLDSYPTTRKIKVSIRRQDGVPTIVARMIGQLRIG